MTKRLRSLAVLAFTVILLYLVIRKVGIGELVDTMRQADPLWLVLSLLLSPFLVLVSVIKWQILLRSQGMKVSLGRLYALYLVGHFFNYFLPSNVGGDVVRGYELGNYLRKGAQAMASVFMERYTGFVMLVAFAVVSSLTNLRFLRETGLAPAVLIVVLALLVVLWLILDERPMNLLNRLVRLPLAQAYLRKLNKFHASLNSYRNDRATLVAALGWSMAFMILAILNVYVTALAFHQPVSPVKISVIVPFILIVSMFPLTINGLGVNEWAYVLLFTWFGMPASLGLSTVLFIRAKNVLFSLVGGVLYPKLKMSGAPAVSSGYNPEEEAERAERRAAE